MDSFTLIALVLSVFGGTYTAMAAMKGWFDPFIKKAKENRNAAMQEMDKIPGRVQTQKTAKGYNTCLSVCCWIYEIAHSVPIFAFTVFSFYITVWSVQHWNVQILGDDSGFWKGFLETSAWINLGCLIVALISFGLTLLVGIVLERHWKTAMEAATDGIEPAKAAS